MYGDLSLSHHFAGGFDHAARMAKSAPLAAIPEILPDCKAKKQERDRGDQIFFETVAEVTKGITTCASAVLMYIRP